MGGGYSLTDFVPDWVKKRIEIGVPLSATVCISVGELNKNKNNRVIIEAIKEMDDVHYILCGVGSEESTLCEQCRDFSERVHFLGYRTDVKELLSASDIFVLPSLREGLSRSLMEAMASGLPCVVSNIRGNVDLVDDENGICCTDFVYGITMMQQRNLDLIRKHNLRKATGIDSMVVRERVKEIYEDLGNE